MLGKRNARNKQAWNEEMLKETHLICVTTISPDKIIHEDCRPSTREHSEIREIRWRQKRTRVFPRPSFRQCKVVSREASLGSSY